MNNLRLLVTTLLFLLPSAFSGGLPHFFPNISSIPPSLIPNATAWNAFRQLTGCHAGEKKDGLSKLKQYFQRFGYINSDNYTDEFDDDFASALKTYQLNFNLNATGELDDATVKQIVRPRCGVADVVNGTSTMNSGKAPSTPMHLKTVQHYTFFPGQPKWPARTTDLTYAFLPENQLSDEVKAVFGTAFERWSEVIPITFTETMSFFSADIKIGFFSGDHGDGENFDGVLGTLAHAFSPPSGRLHLDGEENWVINIGTLASQSPSAVDLESVAVHEIGHLLGLGHSSVEDSIMYPTISSGSRKVELASDDVQGIQVLYGSNPNYTGPDVPTATTTGQRDTSGTYFARPQWAHVSSLLAVGLFLFVL